MIAWTLDPEQNAGDTGHVLFVVSNALVNPSRNDEVVVVVADSSWHPHGTIDPRAQTGASGVAIGGVFGIVVDAHGAPVAYRWNGGCGPDAVAANLALAHAVTP